VKQWQVEAESFAGAKMAFGLVAPDYDSARSLVAGHLPWKPYFLTVTEVEPLCGPHKVRRCGKCGRELQ
jgi:hypothetical protein